MYFIPIRITGYGARALPNKCGNGTQEAQKDTKGTNKTCPRLFLCFLCSLLCLLCSVPDPVGQSPRSPISRMTFSINCSDAICHIWQQRVFQTSDSSYVAEMDTRLHGIARLVERFL